VAPAAGNLRFWTGLLFLSRASVGSDADGHTTVDYLWVERLIASFLFSRQGVVALATGNLRFWTGQVVSH
jgi:hypothetical protein